MEWMLLPWSRHANLLRNMPWRMDLLWVNCLWFYFCAFFHKCHSLSLTHARWFTIEFASNNEVFWCLNINFYVVLSLGKAIFICIIWKRELGGWVWWFLLIGLLTFVFPSLPLLFLPVSSGFVNCGYTLYFFYAVLFL